MARKDNDTEFDNLMSDFDDQPTPDAAADVTDEPVAEVKKASTAPKKTAPAKPKTVRIQLEENDSIPPTGLYLGHNGRGYLISAGEPVDVPPHILEILDHAIESIPRLDPRTQGVIGYRNKMRYPYRRISG